MRTILQTLDNTDVIVLCETLEEYESLTKNPKTMYLIKKPTE